MSGALKPSDHEIFYVHRKGDDDGIPELGAVELLRDVRADTGSMIAAGSVGTVVTAIADGKGYIVEFAEPVGTLVSVESHLVRAA